MKKIETKYFYEENSAHAIIFKEQPCVLWINLYENGSNVIYYVLPKNEYRRTIAVRIDKHMRNKE